MNPVRLNLQSQSLPLDFCWTTPQAFQDQLAKSLSVSWNINFSFFNFGRTKPAAGDNDKPWLRTNADGTIDGWYTFSNGAWLRPHPVLPGITTEYSNPPDGVYTAEMSTQSFFNSLDGGNPNPVTLYDGPFWILNNNNGAQGRFHVNADVSGTFFPVGLPGPKANDPPGFQPNGPPNSMIPYMPVPYIRRSIRQFYRIL